MKLVSQNSVLNLSRLHIMGILNVTPDSFFDGGRFNLIKNAVKHVNFMIQSGATIIDIGGESTRPGAKEVSLEEELSRVIPVVEAISQRFKVWISVDTSKPEVMRESAKVGVHMINDVRSLTKKGAINTVAEIGLPVCLTHIQTNIDVNKQNLAKDKDIFTEVNQFFIEQIDRCKKAGIIEEKILLDPGFGFGKSLKQNYNLLAQLSKFNHFNKPLIVGMSRKSMIGKILSTKPKSCLNGSLSCAVIAAMQGVHIIRVHDVKETLEAMCVVKATISANKNKYYESSS